MQFTFFPATEEAVGTFHLYEISTTVVNISNSNDHDNEWTYIDSSIVKAHQHVIGNTTKIHLAVDAMGLPICFTITGGDEQIREFVLRQGAQSNIPRKNNCKIGASEMDWCLYKYRHLFENVFTRLKHFRSAATRYEKLKRNYEGFYI